MLFQTHCIKPLRVKSGHSECLRLQRNSGAQAGLRTRAAGGAHLQGVRKYIVKTKFILLYVNLKMCYQLKHFSFMKKMIE